MGWVAGYTCRGGLGRVRPIQEQCCDIIGFGEKPGKVGTLVLLHLHLKFSGYLSRRIPSAKFKRPFWK